MSIEMISDEKGYLDRECPHEECEFVFKIQITIDLLAPVSPLID
ncbi:hypothetical protein [Salipaludibacillus daqingensis]|nr:hypothetical protein [Salipaludibacillus daqingensis]